MSWIQNVLQNQLSEEEKNDFLSWSFGEDYKKLHTLKYRQAWNDLHSDKLIINGTDLIDESFVKMYDLYKQNTAR